MKKITKVFVLMLLVLVSGVCISTVKGFEGQSVQTVYAATYKQGATGETIKKVQQKLKNWGYYKGTVDGIFGPKTLEAVKYFQRRNNLVVDGIIGPKTLAAMGIKDTSSTSSGTGTSSGSSYSNADIDMLAHLIYGEARGESYTGQVAVGAVVMNRIKSSSFPNTMSGVIYQKYAFTAVSDGQFNLTPNATARKAAQDAMNGWDPTYGALYYYNPVTATSSWIFSRQTTITIGRHVFAK